MTDLNLDRLAGLEKAATEGPWAWHSRQTVDGDSWAVFDNKDHVLADNRDGWAPDAEFIAEIRNALPALISRVRELEAAVERVKAGHRVDRYTEGTPSLRCVCEESWPCWTIEAIEGADETEA